MITFPKKFVQQTRSWIKTLSGHKGYLILAGLVILQLLVLLSYGVFRLAYSGKAFPGLSLVGKEVSGMTDGEINSWLMVRMTNYESDNQRVELEFEGELWGLALDELGYSVNNNATTYAVMDVGRRGSLPVQFSDQWEALIKGKKLQLVASWNEDLLNSFVASVAAQVNVPAIPPTVTKNPDYTGVSEEPILVDLGQSGRSVDQEALVGEVVSKLVNLQPAKAKIVPVVESYEVSEKEIRLAREKATKLIDKELVIVFESDPDRTTLAWTLTDEDLISFVSPSDGWYVTGLEEYVASIAETVDRTPQDALFQFDDVGQKVVEFLPGKDGLKLDQLDAIEVIKNGMGALIDNESVEPVVLTANRVAPKVTNDQVNELGIKELLGRGESTFYGSIASRIHNIKVAASRINGVLVPPGETFSYNTSLGEVSVATGFQTAYIIRDGRTVLGDGGGVCQDSTTLFRAVLDAGLPITEWRYHSYRVGYYEQNEKPGFDATVFSPTTDFVFLNDTPAYVLVQARVVGSGLTVELYGTNDGRVATISNYAMWDVAPPPPDLYQDDPTLPAGTVNQVDWKAWGAKTKFDYKVTNGEETLFEKTFYSNFKPWQSVFLRGTGGV